MISKPWFFLAIFAAIMTAPTSHAAESARLELPSFGISIPVPPGFTRGFERTPWFACKFEVLNDKGVSQQLITVQIAKLLPGTTIQDAARKVAGQDSPLFPIKWGGIEGFGNNGDPAKAKDNWYDVRHALIQRDAYTFLMTYAAVPGQENIKIFEDLIAATIWTQPASVAQAVKARGQGVKLIGGLVADLPDPLRREKKPLPDATVELFTATNFKTDKAVMRVAHVLKQGDATTVVDHVTESFELKSDHATSWEKSTDGKSAISSVISTPDRGDVRGVVKIDSKFVVHYFVFSAQRDAGDPLLVNNAAKILFDSVK